MSETQQSASTDRILWSLVAAAIMTLVVVLVLSHLDASRSLAFAADAVTVVLTFFVSYVVTRHFAIRSAKSELADLGMATGEQTVLVTDQIRELAAELYSFETSDERGALFLSQIANQLGRLSSQAELSFKNVQRMAGLDLSIDDLRIGVESTVEPGTVQELVRCPNCGEPKKVALSTLAGRNRATRCGKCKFGFTLNRLAENKIKITFEDVVRIDCPNPECDMTIPIKKKDRDQGVIIRNCFECYARIRFDVDSDTVDEWEIDQPLDVDEASVVGGHIDCPYCSRHLRLLAGRNSRGERVISCVNCTRLLRLQPAA